MVCYHKEWVYFSRRFGLPCVDYVEPKPGIPPSPRHVHHLIEMMRRDRIAVLFSPNYYDRRPLEQLSARTGARPVIVAGQTGGAPGLETYEQLVDSWVGALRDAFAAASSAGTP
jgi:ABC-type Zn uptake system ZnuABC Zn-binding protein ZnuA